MMDYFCQKLRALRPSKCKSPKYQRAKVIRESPRHSSASETSTSFHTASPNIVGKVLFGRPLRVNYRDEESHTNFSESEFVIDCFKWHNVFREKHGVPPLKLSNQLCSMAQFWANHLAHTNTFYHRNIRDVGENLFCKWSYVPDFDLTGEQVTKYWYDEIKMYNFYQEPSLLHVRAGHFTQMVWRSSTEFGVGQARSRCGKMIVVANYKPSGNVIGEFQDNVFSPLNDSEDGDEED